VVEVQAFQTAQHIMRITWVEEEEALLVKVLIEPQEEAKQQEALLILLEMEEVARNTKEV